MRTKENRENIYKMLNAWLRNSRSILAFMKKDEYKEWDRRENAWRAVEQFLIVFLCWLITFIIQITWNTILYDFHVTPAINYGKLLVLFFFKTLPELTSFSFFFWFTPDDGLRENNSTSSSDESLLRISCNFSSCTF